jgi:predicted acetyltransferase
MDRVGVDPRSSAWSLVLGVASAAGNGCCSRQLSPWVSAELPRQSTAALSCPGGVRLGNMELRLRPLRVGDRDDALAAHSDLLIDDFEFLLGWEPAMGWERYVEALGNRRGVEMPAGWVPATFLVAILDDVLLGRVSVRHDLNEYLESFGGHIGYAVRPEFRSRGIGTEILRQALVVARAEGIDRVLVTPGEENVASIRLVEGCGGVLEDSRVDPKGVQVRRYWIA